jgi:hypothetical protein
LLVTFLAVWLALLAGAAPTARASASLVDQVRQFFQTVTVRIDIETPSQRAICTGWVGWTEAGRSAVYTAAHCFHSDARYRLTLDGGDAVYATGHAKWDALDLMALWLPKGQLPVLRSWKLLPEVPFRALYVLNDRGSSIRQMEVDVDRVFWEIRFDNHPQAVALPIQSLPGTSGSPIIDLADGRLVGMVIGNLKDRPEVAAVVPASNIYDVLMASGRARLPEPAAAATSP